MIYYITLLLISAMITFIFISLGMLFVLFRRSFIGAKIPKHLLYLFLAIIFIAVYNFSFFLGLDSLLTISAGFFSAFAILLCVHEIYRRTRKKIITTI